MLKCGYLCHSNLPLHSSFLLFFLHLTLFPHSIKLDLEGFITLALNFVNCAELSHDLGRLALLIW